MVDDVQSSQLVGSLHNHLQSLKDQVKDSETTHDAQLVNINIVVSTAHEDVENFVQMQEVKLEISMRTLCRNNFWNNGWQKELEIIPE